MLIKKDIQAADADKSIENRVFILRICSVQKGMILEKWKDFKIYRQNKFSDIIFRHLHIDRSLNIKKNSFQFIDEIIRKPFIDFEFKDEDQNTQIRQRGYNNAEILVKYYKFIGVFGDEMKQKK